MKFGKLTLFAALAAVLLASCTKEDTLYYICRCTGPTAGPVETYTIKSTGDDDAKEQCTGFAQPPAAEGTTCNLE